VWLALLVLLALPLGACSSLSSIFSSDETLPDDPADKLYNQGLYLLSQKKDPKEAAKRFEEVDRQHPYSDWARKALLMTAYAHYEAGDYGDCIGAAQRYVTLHPGSPDAAYAQYLIGAANAEQILDVQRDQARSERAMSAFAEVIRKYPDSEYAASAKRRMEYVRDQVAGKEMEIGRYYMRRKDFTGAINRFKTVVVQYQTTRHVEEALMRLTEAYMTLGIVGEAQTAAAVLGHNFPDSQWYKDAYALLSTSGVQPTENKGSWISRAFRLS
jgi:outer membrane protein assembly factor BamD